MAEASATVESKERFGFVTNIFQRREVGALLAVVALVAIGTFLRSSVFLSADNIVGVLRNTAVVAIIGYGMTLLMVSGEFDLSVGSWMAVSAGIVLMLLLEGYPVLFAILLVLLLAALYGLFQGLLVTKLGLPSLIVTIGTLTLLRGTLLVILKGVTQSLPSAEYPRLLFYLGGIVQIQEASFLPVNQFPNQIFWTLLLLGVGYYVLNKTAFGYRSMFTGGNQDSAERTGIKTDHVKIINFMLVAILAAFAGIGQLAFTQAVSPLTGQGVELIVIASVVIGGTNLFGGEGSIPGTFLGALVFALTQNVLVLAGLGVRLFQIFTGIFIIAAVLIEVMSRELRLSVLFDEYLDPFTSLVRDPAGFYEYVRTDVQGIDKPLAFLTISTVIWTVVSLVLLFVVDALLGWEFSFIIVSAGISALGTMTIVALGLMAALSLLSAAFLHATAKALGSTEDFDTSLQAVMYGLAPSVLLFVPVLLAGWNFLGTVVLATVVLLALPTLYLFYRATSILHGFDATKSVSTVAVTVVLWILVLVYVNLQLAAAV